MAVPDSDIFVVAQGDVPQDFKVALEYQVKLSQAPSLLDELRDVLAGRVYRIHTDAYPALGNLVPQSPDRDFCPFVEECLVAFSAGYDGRMFVDGLPVTTIYWDEGLNAVGWTAPKCKFPEGRITFGLDHLDIVGTVYTADGDVLAVLGEYLPVMAFDAAVDLASAAVEEKAFAYSANFADSNTTPAKAAEEKEVDGEVYETEVRDKNSTDDDDWVPYKSLFVASEIDEVLAPLVFVGLDDVSLSIAVTLTENALRLAKEPLVNAVNATGRLAFDISISGIESERAFTGSLFDGKGEKQFRGRFSGMARKTRGANKPEPSPDGRSLQELIAISSLQRGANIVTPNPEEKQGSVDLAQNEANRLFGRIMLGSVPQDVQDKLYPNVIKLDAEEIKVQEMGKEFFKRAGIHYLMKQLAQSPDIKPELKGKVNIPACEIFLSVCGSLKKPAGDAHDPVTAYGWDREKDAVILQQLQGEYQRVVLECYKLGYRRVVTAFHPFLAQAKYWYQRYAKYVLTPQHTNEFKNRVVAKGETGATLYSLQVKLTLLKEAANGDIGDAKDVATILAELQGSAGMGFIEQVGWDATTQQEVLELFRGIDELEKHGGKEWQEHRAYHDQMKLQEVRGQKTWVDLMQSTIKGLETLRGNKSWTMMEASNILALAADREARVRNSLTFHDEGLGLLFPDKEPTLALPDVAWKYAASHIRSALMVVATTQMLRVLIDPESNKDLNMAEKISMWGSVVQSLATIKDTSIYSLLTKGVSAIGRFCIGVVSIVGRAIGAALRFVRMGWLVDAVKKAAAWTTTAARKTVNWVKGLPIRWDAIGKCVMKVFGFAVSVAALVAAAFDFDKALNGDSRLIDKIFTGAQLVIAGLEVLCLVIHGIGWLAGSTAVCSACAFFGPILMAVGIVVAIVAITVNFFFKEPDPVEKFIEKYGEEYKLLKGMKP